jgi:hypothetical protein
MARSKAKKHPEPPKEITMTDLEAAKGDARRHADIHAAGTPLGGTACGGLAGTNIADGDPDNADLENTAGSGVHDLDDQADDDAY